MRLAVGSKNIPKINAVREAIRKIYPQKDFKLESFAVESGVSDQPMTDEETIRGAINRAKAAREKNNADFGFGLEGGICVVEDKLYLMGWVAVINRNGEIGLASGGRIQLPDKVAKELKKGEKELGIIIDKLSNQEGVKHGLGTAGILTKGLKSRTRGFEDTCISAMARFISPEYYK